jgi:hypothetical protein
MAISLIGDGCRWELTGCPFVVVFSRRYNWTVFDICAVGCCDEPDVFSAHHLQKQRRHLTGASAYEAYLIGSFRRAFWLIST